MEIEKEIRYKANEEIIKKIRDISKLIQEKQTQIDIVLGFYGFDSLNISNFICRIRQKGNLTFMQIKRKLEDGVFEEYKLEIDNVSKGVEFLKAIGMKPYLYLKKDREVREYKGLKIFIDNVDLLGDFIEIEFQDIENCNKIIDEFLNIVEIGKEPQPLYGDIFKEKILKDNIFKEEFEKRLQEILN